MLLRLISNLFRRPAPILPPRSIPSPDHVTSLWVPLFWQVRDQAEFTRKVSELRHDMDGGHYVGDNLITWARNISMLDDAAFVKAWEGNIESDSDKAIAWRRYVLCCAAYHCVQLDGDFVECGAYTGVGVKTVMDYLGGPDFPKPFWAYDAFEHSEDMDNHAMPQHGSGLYERVCKKFNAYPQARIVRGIIPQSFKGNIPSKVAYLHIDLNQPQAEIDALEALFDKVVPGGFVILDDYEWAGRYRRQKLAEDAWFDARRYRVMPLPTGQGLVIKR